MTKKIYRSAQGKPVDLGAIILQNEEVRAVGNMQVNARGDRIDEYGKPISTRSQQVNKSVNRTVSNVKSSQAPAAPAAPAVAPVAPPSGLMDPDLEDDVDVSEIKAGLAGALNRANKK
jgi:hypothetical protein